MQSIREDLLRKVKMAAKVRVVRTASRLVAAVQGSAQNPPAHASRPAPISERSVAVADQRFPVVVLAASTGGPATVMRLAPGFTKEFPAAVILVQHMPAAFTTQFAAQLAEFTEIRVKEAESGDTLQPGNLYICPGSQHLSVNPLGKIKLDGATGRIAGYLPNIDVTMESVAAYGGALAIGVVLTGMGNDGAQGAKAIKKAGGYVIAQDEATSVIFGMPAEAIKLQVVDQVLGIDDIYASLEKRVLALTRAPLVGVR
jgi:two-component system chemotaxis response regulator CheB